MQFLYLAPDDQYFLEILAAVANELSLSDKSCTHLVVPVWGIRFRYQSSICSASGMRRRLGYFKSQVLLKWKISRFTDLWPVEVKVLSPIQIFKTRLMNRFQRTKSDFKLPLHGRELRECVLGIEIEGVPVGDLIYDTYLRFAVKPTLTDCDDFLLRICVQAESLVRFWKTFLNEQKPQAIFGSYASYVQHGIPHRVAKSMNIKSFTFGGLQNFVEMQLDRPDPRHTPKYWTYLEKIREIEKEKLEGLRLKGKDALESRVKGLKDKSTLYMQRTLNGSRNWNTVRGCRVFLLHDFFDSPHIYRWMLFPDFYQWIYESIAYMRKNGLAFAIKPHPNQSSESRQVVASLMKEFPEVTWLDPHVPNSVVFADDPEMVVTVYGSVACEAAFAGQRVLLAGDNPHVSFPKIGLTAMSLAEYWGALADPQKVGRGDPDEAVDFFVAHNLASLEKGSESLISYLGIPFSEVDRNPAILARDDVKRFLAQRSKDIRRHALPESKVVQVQF